MNQRITFIKNKIIFYFNVIPTIQYKIDDITFVWFNYSMTLYVYDIDAYTLTLSKSGHQLDYGGFLDDLKESIDLIFEQEQLIDYMIERIQVRSGYTPFLTQKEDYFLLTWDQYRVEIDYGPYYTMHFYERRQYHHIRQGKFEDIYSFFDDTMDYLYPPMKRY